MLRLGIAIPEASAYIVGNPGPMLMLPSIDDIRDNFELLDEGHDQFEYLMELGRMLPPMPPHLHRDDKLVPGCQSKVWLDIDVTGRGPEAVLDLQADSDAHITKGLVAFLVALYSGRTAETILNTDALGMFKDLGLGQHITSKRSNGLRSMVERIRGEAREVAAETAGAA
jgi:cysteine desulfuration protein SufE